jgi:DNA-binding CsgD family transcriptional regulator
MQNLVTQEQVHHLWDELHAIPSAEADRPLLFLLEAIAGWIGADKAYWAATACFPEAAGRPDGLRGWRTCAYRSLHPYTKAQLKLLQDIRKTYAEGTIDPGDTTRALVVSAGTHRTRRLHDGLVDFDRFSQTQHYRIHYETFGIVDRLWSVFPVSQDAEAYFFFDLIHKEQRFTVEDIAVVATALRPLHWLHQRLFLSHGILIASKPLTRTQRQIVHLLLTGKSEREIAEETGQNPATTHKHIETIYRAFGVNSRAALMALWLAGG